MAYEYEKRIRSSVELELFRDGRHFHEYDAEVIKELKGVYAKAKAFDEIEKSIIQIKCNYKGNEERINKFIARETEYIIDREDK